MNSQTYYAIVLLIAALTIGGMFATTGGAGDMDRPMTDEAWTVSFIGTGALTIMLFVARACAPAEGKRNAEKWMEENWKD